MIVDTSVLMALFRTAEDRHAEVVAAVEEIGEPLVLSPYVVAEIDHLIATRFGVDAELAVLRELAGGAWTLAPFDEADLAAAADVVERYHDQAIGVTDASLVILADKYQTRQIATLDRRHFEVLRPIGGGRFTLVPR